jgi:hypothetical protein
MGIVKHPVRSAENSVSDYICDRMKANVDSQLNLSALV